MDGEELAGCIGCVVIIAIIVVAAPIIGSLFDIVGSLFDAIRNVFNFVGDVIAFTGKFLAESGIVIAGSIITISVLSVIGSIIRELDPEKEKKHKAKKKRKQAEAEQKAKYETEQRAEAERKAKLEAQRIAERKAEQKAEAERKAKLEAQEKQKLERQRVAKITPLIISSIEKSIEAAGDAAIMDAGISNRKDVNTHERQLASTITKLHIDKWDVAQNYEQAGQTEAAQIAAIELTGNLAINSAVDAAILCRNMSTSAREAAFKSAREAAIKSVLYKSGFEANIGSEAIDAIVNKVVTERAFAIESAQAVSNASQGARIVTDIGNKSIKNAVQAARLAAVSNIMSAAIQYPGIHLRILVAKVDTAISITDLIESTVETAEKLQLSFRWRGQTKAREFDEIARESLKQTIPNEIRHASKAAKEYIPPGTLNLPIQDYRRLPKLKSPAGYVYVIQEIEFSRLYKIGRTNDPATRSSFVDLKTPGKTQVIAILKAGDDKALENRLHKKYARVRKQGEWFDLTDEQVREIREM